MDKTTEERIKFEKDLIGYAIKRFHDELVNMDQGGLDETCNQLKCSEFELFDLINCVADEYNVQLYDETDS